MVRNADTYIVCNEDKDVGHGLLRLTAPRRIIAKETAGQLGTRDSLWYISVSF
jgi:hypothetical protein